MKPLTIKRDREKQLQTVAAMSTFWQDLWKHVSVWKSLMTAHAHNIGLKVRRKGLNVIRKDLTMFLALGPVRTVGIEV